VQLGLIGCGSIGSTLARFLQVEPGVAEIIIWDRARTRAKSIVAARQQTKSMACDAATNR